MLDLMGLPAHRAAVAMRFVTSLIMATACLGTYSAGAQSASERAPVPVGEAPADVPPAADRVEPAVEREPVQEGAEETGSALDPDTIPVADELVEEPVPVLEEAAPVLDEPTEAPADAEEEEPYRYRVEAGDTLAAVADWYGLEPATLAQHIGLDPDARLERGAVLELPHGARLLHTVQAGETLSHLACGYEISVEALIEANGISDPRQVRLGDELRIPPGGLRARPPSARRDSWAWKRAEREIGEAQELFISADFEAALSAAQRAEGHIAATDDEARRFRARAFLLQGMALTGLERRDAARSAFVQARQLDPALTLAPEEVSPKIREIFEEAGKR
jgi:LysM repeat protein